MPERWEREIKKLREFTPTPDLKSRIDRGPRVEHPPPARKRIAAGLTAFVVFAAAAVLVVRVFGTEPARREPPTGSDETLVLELSSGEGQSTAPTARLRYGDRVQAGLWESYTWCDGEECVNGHGDFAFYPPVSEYLVVPPGVPIEVSGDGAVEALKLYVSAIETRPIEVDGLRVPDANATYALEVEAVWDQGEANFFFGVQALSGPEAAPDVLRVDCSAGVARADTAVVRTQSDGLHLSFEETGGFDEYTVVTPEGTPPEDSFGVGGPLPVDARRGVPVDPGRWEIGCGGEKEPVRAGELTAAFELVDPDDHWASFDLACDEPSETPFTSSVSGSVAHRDAAGQLVSGLTVGDRLRGAGYGAEGFVRGPTYVVERRGESVARLQLHAVGGSTPPDGPTWSGTFVACPESGIGLAGRDPIGAPPELPASPFSLWLSADRVPTGPVEVVAVLVNHEGVEATFGVHAKVDRWNGDGWVPHGELVVCMDHWHWTARVQSPGEVEEVPAIGFSAEPGNAGPVERFTTDGLEVGWYRISREANEGIVAATILEVAEDASAPAPLVPVDAPAISVDPPVVPPDGAEVQLYPLIPSRPAGSLSREDVLEAIRGLSDAARLEHWDRSSWVPVGEVELREADADLTLAADVPPLAPGEYRLVREGPVSSHVGHFWVDSVPDA